MHTCRGMPWFLGTRLLVAATARLSISIVAAPGLWVSLYEVQFSYKIATHKINPLLWALVKSNIMQVKTCLGLCARGGRVASLLSRSVCQ